MQISRLISLWEAKTKANYSPKTAPNATVTYGKDYFMIRGDKLQSSSAFVQQPLDVFLIQHIWIKW